ncbi:alpha/beta hydrolase [Streptomyces sp. NPDC047117]|uniref:alpha/beta hydrolase n=1 Tax=Streptomyces sp. NPDC047117 TaxID=3155379 RepID=UPI00340CF390
MRRKIRNLALPAFCAVLVAAFLTVDTGRSQASARDSSTVLAASTAARPAAATREEATYSYGSHVRQRLDAYWNPSGEPQPGVVILHGGYWYEDSGWATWSRTFADAGYAAFSVDYRLNFDAPWPAQRDDALSALAWIKSNATRFGLDPKRIVILGSSAGGQIGTSLATYGSGADRVKGVVGLSPAASPYRAWNDGNHDTSTANERKVRDNAAVLTRCYPDPSDVATSMHPSCWDTWKDTVVKNRASGSNDAPMYLLHSTDDFVPVAHSTDLERAEEVDHDMPSNGVTVETIPGSAHGGAILDAPGVKEKVLSWIAAHT